MDTSTFPANQVALARTFKDLSTGRAKTYRQHLEDAEMVMANLRDKGFRLVPFPPLKSLKNLKKPGRPKKRLFRVTSSA